MKGEKDCRKEDRNCEDRKTQGEKGLGEGCSEKKAWGERNGRERDKMSMR